MLEEFSGTKSKEISLSIRSEIASSIPGEDPESIRERISGEITRTPEAFFGI